jgi:hypothetical protein
MWAERVSPSTPTETVNGVRIRRADRVDIQLRTATRLDLSGCEGRVAGPQVGTCEYVRQSDFAAVLGSERYGL